MTFLPIVDRELRFIARRRSTYWTRMVVALIAIAGAFVVISFAGVFQTRTAGAGGSLFLFLAVVAFLFCALAGVFITSDCLSEEKREGTLGFLFLTDLRGYDVVLGKLMATSLNAFYGLLTIFPVLAITLTLGGVTYGEFWRMVLVFMNTLFFSLAAGLFISSISRQENRAMAGTFCVIVLTAGALPLAQFVLTKLGAIPPHTLSLPSPMTAWQLAFDAPYRAWGRSFWDCLAIVHAIGWGFLALASFLLPRIWQEAPAIGWTRPGHAVLTEWDVSERAARRAPLLDVNPVYWLTSRKHPRGWIVAVTCVLFVCAGWIMIQANPLFGVLGVSGLSFFLPLLVAVPVGLHSCRFFADARRNGALELLLSTPLTVKEILRGQWLTVRRTYLAPVIAVLGLEMLPALTMFAEGGLGANVVPTLTVGGLYFAGMATLVTDVFAAAWVGMLVGLTARKPSHAPGLTLLYAIVIPHVAFCIPRLLIDIPLIFWARDKLYRELRTLSSARYTTNVAPHFFTGPARHAPPLIRT